jgi:transcriptional regulator
MVTKIQTVTPDLKTLQEQKRLLDTQIKEAKAAMPKLTRLESVIERQTATARTANKLAARVQARVKAGQPLDVALDEVFATYRAAVEQLIARAATEAEAES